MTTLTPEALDYARRIFAYHQLPHTPIRSDVMIVLGTNDIRVAEHAATLYHQGYAPLVVTTGGIAHQNDLLATAWQRPEADVFAEVLIARGVPAEKILREVAATNTAQNLTLSKQLLQQRGSAVQRAMIVAKPFMQRRVLATHAVEWPEAPVCVCTWATTFDDYCTTPALTPERVTHIMMGDLQRLWVYAQRGYSAPQRIPSEVKAAFAGLVAMGYTRHLIAED